jgi:L,D-peptidoglycan transpeptidase YkuD (ErfK/YbiS/YcfS/YnhG family)
VKWTRGLFAVLTTALLAGCTSSHATPAQRTAATRPTASLAPTTAPTPTVSAVQTKPLLVAKQQHASTPRATAPKPSRARLLVERLDDVGNARQVVAVTARGYGTSYATLTAFSRTASGWHQVFGPWAARIGYNGFAPPQQKREGDGRTPTGSYGFQFMFGVEPNPGVHFPYRPALTTSWWDDDPRSANYNEWVDSRTGDPGRAPEAMRQVPSYRYGVVIAYNVARTPGRGSAIFLHVAHTGATSGCVSLPEPEVLAALRWLDPVQSPRIIMGTTSAVEH